MSCAPIPLVRSHACRVKSSRANSAAAAFLPPHILHDARSASLHDDMDRRPDRFARSASSAESPGNTARNCPRARRRASAGSAGKFKPKPRILNLLTRHGSHPDTNPSTARDFVGVTVGARSLRLRPESGTRERRRFCVQATPDRSIAPVAPRTPPLRHAILKAARRAARRP